MAEHATPHASHVALLPCPGETSPFLTALPPRNACASAMGCLPCLGGYAHSDGPLSFSNTASSAVGDHSIPQSRRVYFGIFFPQVCG